MRPVDIQTVRWLASPEGHAHLHGLPEYTEAEAVTVTGRLRREGLTAEQAAQTEEVREAVQRLVDRANESVSRAESVRAFRIIPRDFTEESGHLTPSMKIRRPQVMRDYQDVIEEIYSSPKPTGNDA